MANIMLIKKIVASGNGLAIILPKKFLRDNEIKKGDFVKIDRITKVEFKDVKEKSKQKKLGAPVV